MREATRSADPPVNPRTTRERSRSVEAQFFRMLNGIVEPYVQAGCASPRLAPGGLILLEVKRRRTGRRSNVPLAALRILDHAVVSTFRGQRSEWVKDLSANPEVRYWIGGRPRNARAVVISARHRPPARSELPQAVRWLLPFLVPYTRAGWAFALLSPQTNESA